eukprot:COSAG02_NODE_432_length_22440_cov_53.821315_14_plen_178_part_00
MVQPTGLNWLAILIRNSRPTLQGGISATLSKIFRPYSTSTCSLLLLPALASSTVRHALRLLQALQTPPHFKRRFDRALRHTCRLARNVLQPLLSLQQPPPRLLLSHGRRARQLRAALEGHGRWTISTHRTTSITWSRLHPMNMPQVPERPLHQRGNRARLVQSERSQRLHGRLDRSQ